MIRRLAILFCLGLVLAACGRVGDPQPPAGARADAPRVPSRGGPTLYPY